MTSTESDVPSANLILPGLWLGNYHVALDCRFLKTYHIDTIINVTRETPCPYRNIVYLRIPIKDKCFCHYYKPKIFDVIDYAADFIATRLNFGNVLVHCKQGHHRSAGMIMAYLIKYHGMNFRQSLNYVQRRRPSALKRKTCLLQWIKAYDHLIHDQ